jgi:hypothetical protein
MPSTLRCCFFNLFVSFPIFFSPSSLLHLFLPQRLWNTSSTMADTDTNKEPVQETPAVTSPEVISEEKASKPAPEVNMTSGADPEYGGFVPRPSGWMYKEIKLGPINLGWYASPSFQLFMVAFVCFLCPGMFNAIGGLGGVGQFDVTTANEANIALYCCFCIVGFFAGSIVNRVGVKYTLAFGGIGYCIYIAGFLCYSHTANSGFTIFAGAFLGLCAALLWAAQGTIMMSYPPEKNKGKYIACFWAIFNLGGVVGSLVRAFAYHL